MKEKDHSTYYYIHKTTNVLSVKLDTDISGQNFQEEEKEEIL